MEVKYDNDNLYEYLISCEDAYTVISYYGGSTYFIPYVYSSTMVHGNSYPLIKRESGTEVTTTQTWFDLYYLSGDPQYEHIFIPASQGVFGLVDVASSVTADIGMFVDYTPETNISPSNTAILYDVYSYFTQPTSGTGTATVEIDIEGEQLTFESQMLGNTITRFIDDDAEVDMEE